MKFSRRIYVYKERCPGDLFESIVNLKPECYHGGGSFVLETKPDDEAGERMVDEIRAMLEKNGLNEEIPGVSGAFTHDVHFDYELCDFQAASLLRLVAQKRMFKGIDSGERDGLGRVWLPATEAKPTIKIASIFPRPWIVVSDKTRRILEDGGLIGLKFDEVSIKGHSVHASPDSFWELRSTITLPQMVNSVPDAGVPWKSFLIKDSFGEPHYRSADLQPLNVFDIAHTLEPLGGRTDPSLIVSQRFYQHCLKNKIPLEVRPVRIDP
jgi:hypothetical protein